MKQSTAEEKVCLQCRQSKPFIDFPKDLRIASGYRSRCKICTNNKKLAYHHTPAGFLSKAYLHMRARVTGKEKVRTRHLYLGLPLLSKDDFIKWTKSNPDFWRLFRLWVQSGYSYKLSPSINRIDPNAGYVLGNIEWLTHSLNSGLARHKTDATFQRIYASIAA